VLISTRHAVEKNPATTDGTDGRCGRRGADDANDAVGDTTEAIRCGRNGSGCPLPTVFLGLP